MFLSDILLYILGFVIRTQLVIALTILVYVQTPSGMGIGFRVSAAAMAMGFLSLICGTLFYRNKPPQGSILTTIAQIEGNLDVNLSSYAKLGACFTKEKILCRMVCIWSFDSENFTCPSIWSSPRNFSSKGHVSLWRWRSNYYLRSFWI